MRLCHMAQPTLAPRIGVWDLNYLFFSSFETALLSYELGKGRFENYLLSILSHEIVNFVKKEGYLADRLMRLDDPFDPPSELTFADVIESPEEDPRIYLERGEALEKLAEVIPDLSEEEVAIASLRAEGLSFREIGERLGLSRKQVRNRFERYRDLLKAKGIE